MGTNADEGSLFLPLLLEIVPGVRLPLTAAALRAVVAHFFNASATEEILAYYARERPALTRDETATA